MATSWESLVYVVIFFVTFLVYIRWVNSGKSKSRLPAGPRGIPILGHLHHIFGYHAVTKLSEWAEEYGDIFTVKFGPTYTAVVVNDVKTMKEVFSIYPSSTGKHNSEPFLAAFGGQYGVLPIEGHQWTEQRQFCLRYLRDLGFGKSETQGAIIEHESTIAIDWIREESKKHPVFPLHEFQKATLNSLWTIVTGETFSSDDRVFSSLIDNYINSVQAAMKTGLALVPWISQLSKKWSGMEELQLRGQEVMDFVETSFQRHEVALNDGEMNDLVDAYLLRMKKETNVDSTFYGKEGFKQCLGTVIALYIAGGETTSSTITWLLFYLICFPDKKEKMREEIFRVIGEGGTVTMKDKSRLPYTEAVILEVFRKSSLVPIGVIHKCLEDTPYGDFIFPKDTLLVANLYRVHHNKKIWGDPEAFRPERFLEENQHQKLKDFVIPFQVGKRACLAEGLARDLIFIFSVKVLQAFDVESSVKDLQKYMQPRAGFLRLPPHIPIKFTPRNL